MAKTLVAYFSAGGVTKGKALDMAECLGADVYEITPQVPYTTSDLDWMNPESRSSVEMNDKTFRPAIVKKDLNVAEYDDIYLGFPIWWYVAPTIINTFLESYDFSNKQIKLFATSGGSEFGNTAKELEISAGGAKLVEGKILNGATKKDIEKWLKNV